MIHRIRSPIPPARGGSSSLMAERFRVTGGGDKVMSSLTVSVNNTRSAIPILDFVVFIR
jgi:hypothetical protein